MIKPHTETLMKVQWCYLKY